MGITIHSKDKSIDIGGSGFKKLRSKIAELAGEEIKEHYDGLFKIMCIPYWERKSFYEEYDNRTEELVEKYKDKETIFDFLYAPDVSATFTPEECQCIWELIKDYDDKELYGYAGRKDCAKFTDFKEIVKECIDNGCNMEWS